MNKIIFLLCIFFSVSPFVSRAQFSGSGVIDGSPMDSIIIRLNNTITPYFISDTSTTPLWQTGHTNKPFYTNDTVARLTTITDTSGAYPALANNWFIIKAIRGFNTIIDFWHKYNTDTIHAGGIVEFSFDHGAIWQNVKGDCNGDSSFMGHGVLSTNFYTFADTIFTGEPAFTGSSAGTQYSRFQFFDGYPLKTTNGITCNWSTADTFYIRFRFVSDTATDTLAGWEIDSVKIEHDYYAGSVARISKPNTLKIFPNPSYNGMFTLPVISNQQQFTIEIYNAIGELILKQPYTQALDISGYAKGMYFYKASDGSEYYSGQLLVE